MRILFIQKSAGTGGSKSSLLAGLPSLKATGCEVTVLCAEEGPFTERCRELGIPVALATLPEWRKVIERVFFSYKLDRAMNSIPGGGFDVVISNEMWWAPHALHLGSRFGAMSAVIVRDLIAVGPKARQYRFERLDRVLCVSDAIRAGLSGLGIPEDRLKPLYNPIGTPGRNIDAAPEWRKQRPHVQRWLGYIGKIGERKNQIHAVRVLARLREMSGEPWGLVLAGEAETEYIEKLRAEVVKLRLGDSVVEAGHVDPVGNVIGFVDAVVLTSRREGLPRSLIEAYLAGVPAFSYALDGLDEIYGEFFSTFVAESPSEAALARLIDRGFGGAGLKGATATLAARLRRRHDPSAYPERLRRAIFDA